MRVMHLKVLNEQEHSRQRWPLIRDVDTLYVVKSLEWDINVICEVISKGTLCLFFLNNEIFFSLLSLPFSLAQSVVGYFTGVVNSMLFKACIDLFGAKILAEAWTLTLLGAGIGIAVGPTVAGKMLSTQQASADDRSTNLQMLYKMSTFWNFMTFFKSPWEMHSNKYQHAWYWFRTLWNSR